MVLQTEVVIVRDIVTFLVIIDEEYRVDIEYELVIELLISLNKR